MKVATRARAARASGALATLTLAALLGCSPASDEPEHPGKAVYLRYCFSCHQAGIAGAPKLGDQEAWQPRIAQGRDAMLDNVKRGMVPGMPPRLRFLRRRNAGRGARLHDRQRQRLGERANLQREQPTSARLLHPAS